MITCPATHEFIETIIIKMKDKIKKIPTYDKDKEFVTKLVDEIEVFLRMGTTNHTN